MCDGVNKAPGVPQVIEWQDLDKTKYYVLGPAFNLGTLCILYPTKLVKIRLQAQVGNSMYKGTFDAFRKIIKREGFRSLYKGIGPNTLTVVANQFYITSYEWSKSAAKPYCEHESLRNLGAGVLSACVSQFISVPADVVSQKLMVQGQNSTAKATTSAKQLIRDTFAKEGIKGFYKGYRISLLTFAPSSGIFWSTYGLVRRWQAGGSDTPPSLGYTMLQQTFASAFGGAVSAIVTNPLDVIKTNLQLFSKVGDKSSILGTANKLSKQEGISWLYKGLTGRILHNSANSVILVVAYETLKYISLR